MKDEVKEILKEVNKIIDNTSYNEEFTYFQTSHISKLLDCITNLQEENKMYAQLKDEYEDIIDKAIKYIDNIGFLDWEDKLQDILLSGKKMKKILEGNDKE